MRCSSTPALLSSSGCCTKLTCLPRAGKSTLTDSLVAAAGIIAMENVRLGLSKLLQQLSLCSHPDTCRLATSGSQTRGRTSRTGVSPSSPQVGLIFSRQQAALRQAPAVSGAGRLREQQADLSRAGSGAGRSLRGFKQQRPCHSRSRPTVLASALEAGCHYGEGTSHSQLALIARGQPGKQSQQLPASRRLGTRISPSHQLQEDQKAEGAAAPANLCSCNRPQHPAG